MLRPMLSTLLASLTSAFRLLAAPTAVLPGISLTLLRYGYYTMPCYFCQDDRNTLISTASQQPISYHTMERCQPRNCQHPQNVSKTECDAR